MKNELPKYQWLAGWIKNEIAARKLLPGDKLYTESELVHRFSLSRHTVRQAISILENEGVITRSRGSGTYISPINRSRSETKTIGVVTTYLDDHIFPAIIQGIDGCLAQNGYTMQLGITYNKPETEAAVIKGMLERGVDGFILEPAKSALPNIHSQLYMQIKKSNIPCVMINVYHPGPGFPCITPDDRESAHRAVEFLVGYGHKNIAGIFKSDDLQGHLRYLGYSQALQAHSLPVSTDHVLWYTTEDIHDIFSGSAGELVLKRLKNCSGAVCYNDQVSIMLMELLYKNGVKVPEDISIVSFDDSPLAPVVTPGLTTFAHPKEELGREAALQIMGLIKNETHCTGKIYSAQLMIRASAVKNSLKQD